MTRRVVQPAPSKSTVFECPAARPYRQLTLHLSTEIFPSRHIASETARPAGVETPIPLRWIVAATLAGIAALAILLEYVHIDIALNGAAMGFGLAGLVLFSIRHLFRRGGLRARPMLSDSAEDALLFIVISLAGAVASYGVAALTHGWVDGTMVQFDSAVGFDWNALYALTAAHPAIQWIGRIAYASIFASPALILLAFARNAQRDEARRFLASFLLAAMISLTLFRWLPTLGPLVYSWHGPIVYMPTSGLYQADLIPLLRDGRAGPIDLGHLRGLVGPPSFHAASATLYILAAWRTRHLRWPLTGINAAMLLSIPVEGTHYAIDVVSGTAVALAAHIVIEWLARRRIHGT